MLVLGEGGRRGGGARGVRPQTRAHPPRRGGRGGKKMEEEEEEEEDASSMWGGPELDVGSTIDPYKEDIMSI